MNTEGFRLHGKNVVDYICDYNSTLTSRQVAPNLSLEPGFLKNLIPAEAPEKGEDFNQILEDVETKIMPGMVHWNHPNFFAYFPAGNSYPSVLADMLSSAIGSIGFSWASSPSMTELETIVLDWYGKALDLPKFFLTDTPGSRGGGVLQGSASECALVCLIAARARAIKMLKGNHEDIHDSVFLPQLVAYCSKEGHSSIEKACKMAITKLRILDTDDRGRFRGETLRKAIEEDLECGLTPFFVAATVGTTGQCAFDHLVELGQVCERVPSVWFHVDGAYAGNAFILPEMKRFKEGLEYADSFNTNPNKLFLTSFDASAMWVKDVKSLTSALTITPLYLQHEHENGIDYRHYGIPLSRRFRALKLWFVMRTYGINGLRNYIRRHIQLAQLFVRLVHEDDRFEVLNDVHLGLVCFRLKNSDLVNTEFLARVNHSGKLHMIPSEVSGKYTIRFCVTYEHATEKDILSAWKQIQEFAEITLESMSTIADERIEPLQPTKKRYGRTMPSRFSFTRSVSREIYEQHLHNSGLTDGCTPICVLDSNDIFNDFDKAAQKNEHLRNTDCDLECLTDDVSN